jgi:hypothetical protein
MAVSKRLRFEILKRDQNRCKNCGRGPDEVVLNVDHVIPVSLGGKDDPTNLRTLCRDCNSGKSSTPTDAPVVADVADDATRWAAAIRKAAEEARLHDNTEVYDAVVNAWTSYRRREIPADYMEAIDRFLDAGLPAEDIVQMARVADAKPSVYDRWAYFCGCCWSRLTQLQERATQIVHAQPSTVPRLTTEWTQDDIKEFVDSAAQWADSRLSPESIDSARCIHRERGEGSCDDPVCQVIRAEALNWMAYSAALKSDRQWDVVMAAEATLDD